MYIAPTVGRIVYFFDPNTRHAENDEIITQAAIIAHVHGSNSSHSNVNLAVFAADGSTFKRLNVPLIQDGWSLPSPIGPYATWTPHQIGTAKAEAALSAAALEKNREETAQQFAMPDIPEGHEFAQIGGISAISPLPLPTVKDIDDDTLAGLIKASSQDSSNRDRTFPVHFENGHIYVNKDVLEAEAYRRNLANQPQKAQAPMPDTEVGEPDALMSVCHADWHFLDSLYGSMLDNSKYKELQNLKSRIAVALAKSPAAEQEQAVMDDLKVAIGNAAIGNSPGDAEAFKAKHLTQMPIKTGIPYDYTLWSGGPCPVPNCIVDMYLRDGSFISDAKASSFDWHHDVVSEDRQIVAYKVLGPVVEQKDGITAREKALKNANIDALLSQFDYKFLDHLDDRMNMDGVSEIDLTAGFGGNFRLFTVNQYDLRLHLRARKNAPQIGSQFLKGTQISEKLQKAILNVLAGKNSGPLTAKELNIANATTKELENALVKYMQSTTLLESSAQINVSTESGDFQVSFIELTNALHGRTFGRTHAEGFTTHSDNPPGLAAYASCNKGTPLDKTKAVSKFDGMPDESLTYLARVTQDLPACTAIAVDSLNLDTGDVFKVADVTHAEIIAEQTRRLGARMTAFTSGPLGKPADQMPSKLAAFSSEDLHRFLDELRSHNASEPRMYAGDIMINLKDVDEELTLRGDFYGVPRYHVQGTELQARTKSA